MPRLLFGVTGGIAAYKMLETARLAIKAGHAVRSSDPHQPAFRRSGLVRRHHRRAGPVLGVRGRPQARRYPGEPAPERAPISHLALVERADLYLIAPASANTLAKLAHGQADSLVTTAALAADAGKGGSGSFLVAPR